MAELWAVKAVGDDDENAGEVSQLGTFIARCEVEAAHIALINVGFERGGVWRITAHPASLS